MSLLPPFVIYKDLTEPELKYLPSKSKKELIEFSEKAEMWLKIFLKSS